MRIHNADQGELRMRPAPGCTCGKPLMIVIKAGEHIHPCPVHTDQVIYGRQIAC